MANTRNGGSSKSSSSSAATLSSRKSTSKTSEEKPVSGSSKGKALRPLSSVLGFGGGGSSSLASSSKASTSSSSTPKKKSTKTSPSSPVVKQKSSNKSSDAVDPIELSSDDEVDDFLEIKDGDDSATENSSEDEVLVTGYSAASASTSKVPPSSSKKATSSSSSTKAPVKATSSSSTTAKSPLKVSAKSKGKEKAVDSSFVELEVTDTREGALWSSKYEPVDFESLCVHKKKVQDVQRWLEEAFAGGVTSKYRRVLVLSGPAGSAKTATLRVLSREMGIDIVEYKTSEGDSESSSNQFPSFLAKATVSTSLQFGVLTADNKIAIPMASTSKSDVSSSTDKKPAATLNGFTVPKASTSAATPPKRRKLILVEDLPNIFTSQGTRTSFRNALTAFANSKRFTSLAANANVPLVIIVSEALTRPGQNEGENAANRYQGSGEQSVSVRSVVPPDVLRAPVTAEFKFNPIAPTLMKKALNAILDREYESSSSKRPSQRAVQLVIEASDGDIRSALNTLQFIVGDAAPVSEVALENAKKKGKKRKSSGKVKDDEVDESANKALMHLVATKESSLFLFHALGKVLFNKRWGENPDEDSKSTAPQPAKPTKLPPHLKTWERRVSKVDPNALFSDAPVETDMFMAYLHQNYPPFCDDIENCANLMEYTSVADAIMRMEGDNFSRHALTSHYSFQVSVRGALMSLPSPVQRRGQKMYKSELWETQRKAKENLDRIGDWMASYSKMHTSTDDGEDLLPKRLILQLEIIPYMGLMQAPQKSFLAEIAPSSSSSNPFKAPKPPSSLSRPNGPSDQKVKLSSKLLEIAMFPVPAYLKPPNPEERTFRTREALNEKDVPDDDEADEDEMKRKPVAPAVKMEEDEEAAFDAAQEEEPEASKLYLSDDDIGDF